MVTSALPISPNPTLRLSGPSLFTPTSVSAALRLSFTFGLETHALRDTARALSQSGVDATVYEAAPSLKECCLGCI